MQQSSFIIPYLLGLHLPSEYVIIDGLLLFSYEMEQTTNINLDEFAPTTVTITLSNMKFILKRPSVEKFIEIIGMTRSMGENFERDTKVMINVIAELLWNTWFLNWRKWYLRKVLLSLDQKQLTIVRDRVFLALELIDRKESQKA